MMRLAAEVRIGNGYYYQFLQRTTPVLVWKFTVTDLEGHVVIAYPFVGGN